MKGRKKEMEGLTIVLGDMLQKSEVCCTQTAACAMHLHPTKH